LTRTQTLLLTAIAMCAFAANSVLCRMALATPVIDPVSFTAIRLSSGALALVALMALRGGDALKRVATAGEWRSAAALFVYAIAFSLAYLALSASVGALILFGCVQATMIGVGILRGERLTLAQTAGAVIAAAGLVYLLAPGLSAPPLQGAALMALAGAAWGAYSLFGRSARAKAFDPGLVTAGNFLRAAPMALAPLSFVGHALSTEGVVLAVISGAVTSGGGYVIWYAALKGLKASEAAIVQLTVPVLAALGGLALVHEPLTLRFALAAAAILGGVALVLLSARHG
jgi:drug/metabolite transporter (DMT)-like permease